MQDLWELILLSNLDELSLKVQFFCCGGYTQYFLQAIIACLIFYGNDLHANRALFLTSAPAASPRGTTGAGDQLLWIHQDTMVEERYLLGFDVLNLGRRIMLLSHGKCVENLVVPEIWANFSYPVKAWRTKTNQGQASDLEALSVDPSGYTLNLLSQNFWHLYFLTLFSHSQVILKVH